MMILFAGEQLDDRPGRRRVAKTPKPEQGLEPDPLGRIVEFGQEG